MSHRVYLLAFWRRGKYRFGMATAADGQTFITDGSLDFSGGVNSLKVTTIQSQRNPNGLQRNELAWMVNCTVRDGGITPRSGYQYLGTLHDPTGLYQGGVIYQPSSANPYLLICISGHTYQVLPDNVAGKVDLSAHFPGTLMPSTQPYFFFPWSQPEQFTLIQAGDFVTLPLIWDGAVLRRSKGINNIAVPPGTPGVNEIPSAGAMDYFMGRLWYAQGRQYSAGDIVQGSSGTAAYNFRDAVLEVTENPLVLGGDGFVVPDGAGNLRGLAHSIQINATNAQGVIYPFARRAIYSQLVPITRTNWIAANNANQPQQTIAQLSNGSVNDRSIVAVNGDLYYQTFQPGIASLTLATRYFDQPGNIELSAAENRILQFTDRSLLGFATGCFADNRLLESNLPKQLPQGVVHQAIIPLDFLPVSTFGSNFQPAWEGHYEGLNVLQMFSADFGGVERMFMVTVAAVDSPLAPAGSIQLYEQVQDSQFDENATGESRIQWQFETPAYTWGDEFQLKKLVSAEFWVDRIFGEVIFKVEYRPDGESCWQLWHEWEVCSARNTCEDVINPVCYPIGTYGEGYRQNMALPLPPQTCANQVGRPRNQGFQFQLRVTIRGFCRMRGIQLFAEPMKRSLYGMMVCKLKSAAQWLLNRFIG
jgi:hypothetical protein